MKHDQKYPEPAYNLREGRIDGKYAVMLFNSALAGYQFKNEFGWHLRISIDIEAQMPKDNLPTENEAEVLNELEDQIAALLTAEQYVHYVGRTTWNGIRELTFYLQNPELAQSVLQKFISTDTSREFEYEMREDLTWENAASFLQD